MDIAEEKQQILNLIEKLRAGGAAEQPAVQQKKAVKVSATLEERILRRRQELVELRTRRERMGHELLEERLLAICQKLERRIAAIEAVIGHGPPQAQAQPQARQQAKPAQAQPDSGGMDFASNLDAMMPDLEIAGMEASPKAAAEDNGFLLNQASRAEERPVHSLTGLIQDGLLSDVLQMISSNAKTGMFILEDNTTEIRLYFRDGEVYHATTEGMVGQDAFFAAMAMEQGGFFFIETDEIPDDKTIDGNTQFLILEALRQIDEQQGGE